MGRNKWMLWAAIGLVAIVAVWYGFHGLLGASGDVAEAGQPSDGQEVAEAPAVKAAPTGVPTVYEFYTDW